MSSSVGGQVRTAQLSSAGVRAAREVGRFPDSPLFGVSAAEWRDPCRGQDFHCGKQARPECLTPCVTQIQVVKMQQT